MSFPDRIAAAQARLMQAAARAGLTGDPYVELLEAQAEAMGIMGEAVTRLEDGSALKLSPKAETDVVTQAVAAFRHGMKPLRQEMKPLKWAAVGGVAAVALAVGCAGGWFLRGAYGQGGVAAAFRAGPDNCTSQENGGVLCWMPVYTKLPNK